MTVQRRTKRCDDWAEASWIGKCEVNTAHRTKRTMPKTKKTYRVEIEAKLDVEAFDADSAKKKVEKLLGTQRGLGADVKTTGDIWTYAAPLIRDPRNAPTEES
jgi:hypothetical protein